MTQPPDFRELVGDDMDEQERVRLERVHQMLVFAGPPPELPPALLEPDAEPTGHHQEGLPRRRAGALLAIAAAIALVALVGGYAIGNRKGEHFDVRGSVAMHGTRAAPHASATLAVSHIDDGGNWPLRLVVHNLPRLPRNAYYEMFLTKNGKPTASCGTFGSNGKTVTVRLNAPYDFSRYSGWVVTRQVRGSRAQPIVLATARV
jgi:Anti-sigma-K factor rskA, C-terminal